MSTHEFKRSLAVVIGINHYSNGIQPLETPKADAEELARILEHDYHYNEIILVTDETEIEPTRKNLLTLLETTLDEQNLTQSDRLLFYFAGHGIARPSEDQETEEGPQGFLVPSDAHYNQPDSLISMRDIYQNLAKLNCRHLLVILDCCFAGAFRWASTRRFVYTPKKATKAHYERFTKFPAWEVITSSAYNQEALDFLDNREIKDEKNEQHSPFAQALFQALKGKADLNNDGIIIAPELYIYLRDYVENNAHERQTPGFFPLQKHDRGEYIFLTPGKEVSLAETPPLNPNNNPYRGLKAFDEEHSRFFFGRQELIEDLFKQVSQSQHRLTTVVGISGSGKSSLVKAGLIPCIRQDKTRKWQLLGTIREDNNKEIIDPFRPGKNPYLALVQAFSVLLPNQTINSNELKQWSEKQSKTANPLSQLIKSWSKKNPGIKLLLIIDQFEELITLAFPTSKIRTKKKRNWWNKLQQLVKKFSPQSQSKSNSSNTEQDKEALQQQWMPFVELLANTLEECPQLNLVVTLRSDFSPRFANSGFKFYWEKSQFTVRPMRSDELREAVLNPATESALYFEPPELVDTIVDEVSQMPGALPLLSFTLSELYINLYRRWQNKKSDNRALTLEDYQNLGGVAGSLTRRANEEYEKLSQVSQDAQITMRHIMMRMVSETNGELARRQVPKSELIYSNKKKNEQVKFLIKIFIKKRLLVTGTNINKKVYYEPAHDILVDSWIKELLESSKENNPYTLNVFEELSLLFLLRNDLEQYTKNKKNTALLWNQNPRLEQVKQILESDDNWLNKIETEFVKYSLKKKEYLEIEFLKARAKEERQKQNQLEALAIAIEAAEKLQHFLSIPKINIEIDNEKIEQITQELQTIIYGIQERHRLQGHKHWIWGVNFSPDGKKIVSACRDGTVKIWSCNGQELQHIQAHSDAVTYACFSPDSKTIATASGDTTVKIWFFNKQQQKWSCSQTLNGHNDTVWSISFKDHQTMVTGSRDKTAKLWCLNGNKWYLKNTIEGNDGHKAEVHGVTFSPDGHTIATASFDGTVKLWDFHGNCKKTLQAKGNENGFYNVSFSPDGQLIIVACDDHTIKRWTVNGEELESLKGHKDWVKCAIFSPNNQLIASSSADNTIKLWSIEGEELKTLKGHQNEIWSICFSPDSKTIVSGSWDHTVRIWNSKVAQHRVIKRHEAAITSVDFHPNNNIFATASWDNKVKFWNFTGQELFYIDCHDAVRSICFSPNGQLLATGCEKGAVILWNLGGKLLKKWREHEHLNRKNNIESFSVTGITFSPDGKILASASEDRTVKLWDVTDLNRNTSVKTINKHTEDLTSVCFSPNVEETTLASACWGGIIYFSSIADVETSQKPIKNDEAVMSICFSPDSKTIVTASRDRTAKLWNLDSEKPKELATLKGHTGHLTYVCFSPDGKIIATTSRDGAVKLWDINGRELKTLEGHNAPVSSVNFSPNFREGEINQVIVSTDEDGKFIIWNLDNKELYELTHLDLARLLKNAKEWLPNYIIVKCNQRAILQ